MGIKNYLIEGISGVGKTAVAEELEQRGFHVVHGDRTLAYIGDPETGEPLVRPICSSEAERVAWLNKHWIWPVETVKFLITSQRHPITFFCGTSRNAHSFIDLFDAVFVLKVDLETLKQRLAKRPENEFGGRPAEQQLIAQLHVTQEDIPKQGIVINAEASVSQVVDKILARCGV
jgi:dephospho-CoA kinase